MFSRYAPAIAFAVFSLLPAAAAAQLRAEPVASGLTQPVAFVQDPTDATRFVVVQQDGRVRVLKDGVLQASNYLDLRSVVINAGEQGLLGLAFAPDYATSGRVFVNFINQSGNTVIARFRRSASNPAQADVSSRFDLLWPGGQRFIDQNFANHNGGNIVFGPDGYLYIGMGDGGSGNDPLHNAQNPASLLGKMLRVDVSVPDSDVEGYNVPSTNPFLGVSGVLAEIWSFGLRNPWRWSFDNVARGGTGALVMGDVGQDNWEEVDYEPAGRGGRNYGWRNREGAHNNVTNLPAFSQPLTDPIYEYSHSVGKSITGGFVYRGSALGSSFRGRYFFADFINNRVWSLRLSINPTTHEATASDVIEHTAELGTVAASVVSFGEDASGELYILNYGGTVSRLAATVTPPAEGRRRPPSVPAIGFAIPRTGGAPTAPAPAKTAVAKTVVTVSVANKTDRIPDDAGQRTGSVRELTAFEHLLVKDPVAAMALFEDWIAAMRRGELVDDRWLVLWLLGWSGRARLG